MTIRPTSLKAGLKREEDAARDGVRRNCDGFPLLCRYLFHPLIGDRVAEVGGDHARDTSVAQRFGPASCLNASVAVRTAFLVAA